MEKCGCTAEGAVAEAISLSPVNLYRSRCLVTGYGRCAAILADRLKGMGARVTVAGRNASRWSRPIVWDTIPAC